MGLSFEGNYFFGNGFKGNERETISTVPPF